MNKAEIYIVDDNIAVCDALKFLFDSFYKLKVNVYCDPIQFLDEFSPDWEGCLIIDLFMPSMNGIDLVKKLKKLNQNLNIIIMSGNGSKDAGAAALEAGANAFMTKPFKTEYLLTKVISLLKIKV